MLGHNAVHAAMAGKTDMVVGNWQRHFTHVPITMAVAARKKMEPDGRLWGNVLSCTGQPHPIGIKLFYPESFDGKTRKYIG